MSRRQRQPIKTVENLDLQIINTKIQLHRRLMASSIDYDHYRAGAMPQGSVIMSQPWLTLGEVFCDISPCDFENFKLNLLIKYTIGRSDIDPMVPPFYAPREKEVLVFTNHMSTVVPSYISQFREDCHQPKNLRSFNNEFLLDFPTILTTRYRK